MSNTEGILHSEKRHQHTYEATYGKQHSIVKEDQAKENKTVSAPDAEQERQKNDDPVKSFGLGGEYGDHGPAKALNNSREKLEGRGDHIGSHDPFSFIDKKDKAAVHDALLGAEDTSHMSYLS